jgi:hypothetical protein
MAVSSQRSHVACSATQNESRACACPRAISRTIDVAHEVFEDIRDQRTT